MKGLYSTFTSAPITHQSSWNSQTNSHRTGFKSRTKQAETQRFPFMPLYLKSVQNSKRWTSSKIKKIQHSELQGSVVGFWCDGMQPSRRLLLCDWLIRNHHPIREEHMAWRLQACKQSKASVRKSCYVSLERGPWSSQCWSFRYYLRSSASSFGRISSWNNYSNR